ncbi:hypothetical protein GWI33_008318 [Rhynchophorus ferrugineus]|uniref:C2H2-type domain-containing protein n=1 Tax=Rhynchophorus ferrugineus TaxID=354439 RepID=A0A834IXW9_RHYFE|nr:hypothetical protein GWI33_008318 [Rhynchophorus ferrugineus]
MKEYKIFCEYCEKGFVYKHQYKVHLEVKHSINSQRYVCDVCGKEFSLASYLKRHQICHQDISQDKILTECTICNKKYRRINRHYREYHKNDGANFVCDLCGQKFRQSFELKLHTMRHKGEKPHQCTYGNCEKRFVRKQHLKLHMRSHTGEKPYGCNICGKNYTQKPSLVVHMRGHLGERPYECSICVSKFASKQRLNIHRKKVHRLVENSK